MSNPPFAFAFGLLLHPFETKCFRVLRVSAPVIFGGPRRALETPRGLSSRAQQGWVGVSFCVGRTLPKKTAE